SPRYLEPRGDGLHGRAGTCRPGLVTAAAEQDAGERDREGRVRAMLQHRRLALVADRVAEGSSDRVLPLALRGPEIRSEVEVALAVGIGKVHHAVFAQASGVPLEHVELLAGDRLRGVRVRLWGQSTEDAGTRVAYRLELCLRVEAVDLRERGP